MRAILRIANIEGRRTIGAEFDGSKIRQCCRIWDSIFFAIDPRRLGTSKARPRDDDPGNRNHPTSRCPCHPLRLRAPGHHRRPEPPPRRLTLHRVPRFSTKPRSSPGASSFGSSNAQGDIAHRNFGLWPGINPRIRRFSNTTALSHFELDLFRNRSSAPGYFQSEAKRR